MLIRLLELKDKKMRWMNWWNYYDGFYWTLARLSIDISVVAAGNNDPRFSEYEKEAYQAIERYKKWKKK